MEKLKRKKWLMLTVAALLAVGLLLPSVSAAPDNTVSIGPLADVNPGDDFVAQVNIDSVTNFDSANFDVTYEPGDLRLDDVTAGLIGGTVIPVQNWGLMPAGVQGTARVIVNVPDVPGVSGSGYLAELHFHVVGSDCDVLLDLHDGVLFDNMGDEILPASWVDATVHITAQPTVTVTMSAPAEVLAGGDFVAKVNISQVFAFDSASYDVVYDPAVIQVADVTDGEIDGTAIPVDSWGFIPVGVQGKVRIINNVAGVPGVTGEGYLAEIRFHVVGVHCNNSVLDLVAADSVLFDRHGTEIDATWVDDSVHASDQPAVIVSMADYGELPGSDFVATVDISPVVNSDSGNYDVTYDPTVLELTDVSDGLIDGTVIPVTSWGLIPPATQGTVRIINNVADVGGASGSGYLAEIDFHVIGSPCDTSVLDLDNGVLFDNMGDEILPVTWTDGSVDVLATLTVVADPAVGGTVTGDGTYVCCNDAAITATPTDACWYFVGWTTADMSEIADSASANTTVHIDGNKTVTAHFTKFEYTLTVNTDPVDVGIVTGGGDYDCCTDAAITATSDDVCYYFDGWTGTEIASPSSANTTVHIDGNKTVTAHFTKFEYTLTVNTDPVDVGIVTGGGDYDCCTDAAITADPDDVCYYFTGWTGTEIASPSSANTTVHIDGHKTVTAHFTKYVYTLTVNTDPVDVGIVTGGGDYDCCTDADITATSDDVCYYFDGWTGDDIAEPTAASTTVHIDGHKTVTAHFTKYEYDLMVDVDPADGGDIKVNGVIPGSYPYTETFDCCTDVSLEAVNATGYEFDFWDGDLTGSVNPTSIHIDGDKTVTANFQTIEECTTPSDPGDANGDGLVNSTDITKVGRIMLMLDVWVYCGADANGDGVLDSADITCIELIMLGLPC